MTRAPTSEFAPLRDAGPYSARNTSKGAVLDEAFAVLTPLTAGVPESVVKEGVLSGKLLRQQARESRRHIWNLLCHRIIRTLRPWVMDNFRRAVTAGPHSPEFVSLVYLHYALRDRLAFDFITSVLWHEWQEKQSRATLSSGQVLDFLNQATDEPQVARWSESSRVRLSRSLLAALRDFGVLRGIVTKTLNRPPLPLAAAAHLTRVLAAEGVRGHEFLTSRSWRLFLLNADEVADVLTQLDQARVLRFEKAGTTMVVDVPDDWRGQ